MKYRSHSKRASKGELITVLVIGLILGTVFIFLNSSLLRPVTRNEAVRAAASYSSYSARWKRGRAHDVTLHFSDLEPQSVDSSCSSDRLLHWLDEQEPGTQMQMLLHPDSATVLELSANGETVLTFAESQELISRQNTGFTVLGAVLYLAAAYALVELLRRFGTPRRKSTPS